MALAVTTNLTLNLAATGTNSIDLETLRTVLAYSANKALASGTGANQANVLWSDQRTLVASATEDLDLAGVLIDAFGKTVTFTKVKMILFFAAAANTNNVNVTRPAAAGVPLFLAAEDGIGIRPGGLLLISQPDNTGVAVTATTGDLITITNSAGGTSVVYDVIIIGVGTVS